MVPLQVLVHRVIEPAGAGQLGQPVLQGRDVARADGVNVLGMVGEAVDEVGEAAPGCR